MISKGRESGSPEMGTETMTQALRGAAGAKPCKCAKARTGYPECQENNFWLL